MLSHDIVTSIEDFKRLKDEWDELLENSRSDTIFLTWEWQFNWWRSFGGSNRLNIILIRNEKNVLVGIAPLYGKKARKFGVMPFRELRLIGDGSGASSEYLDFIVRVDDEAAVMKRIITLIEEGRKSFDMAVFSELSEASLTKQYAPCFDSGRNSALLIWEKIPSCPVVELKGSWQEYVASVPKSVRRSLDYYRRKIERNFTVKFKECEQACLLEEAFDAFKLFYGSRRELKKERNMYLLNHYDAFHKNITADFSSKGWLYFCTLLLDNRIASGLYSFKYQNKLFLYQLGRDDAYSKFSIGNVLLDYVLEQAHHKGMKELDFLRGDEPYKLRWANETRKKYCVALAASFKGMLSLRLFECKRRAISIKKRVVNALDKRTSYACT